MKRNENEKIFGFEIKDVNTLPLPGCSVTLYFPYENDSKNDSDELLNMNILKMSKEMKLPIGLFFDEFTYVPDEVRKIGGHLGFIATIENIMPLDEVKKVAITFKLLNTAYFREDWDAESNLEILKEFTSKTETNGFENTYLESISTLVNYINSFRDKRDLPFTPLKQCNNLEDAVNFYAENFINFKSKEYHDFVTSTSIFDKAKFIISILSSRLEQLKFISDRTIGSHLDRAIDDMNEKNSTSHNASELLDLPFDGKDENNNTEIEDFENEIEDENIKKLLFGDEDNVDDNCDSCHMNEDTSSKLDNNTGYFEEYVRLHGKSTDLDKYINFLNHLDTYKETKDEIAKEILHLSHERKNTSDYTTCINWLENVLALPWNTEESSDFSIDVAKNIIEKSHYGMKDVKDRIIEFLAVRKKNGNNNGAILCLVGPPGCGKTSIGKSIAEALGKKFTRFSFGSIHDETDIVGHRRTYVASAPGKIMNAIRSAYAKDPVLLIDEVDKASSRQGNPLSALLEVLDPEQNKNFQDVYFDFPFDLSKVVFILTANDLQGIPLPLLDRLEIIEVDGYSENEKLHIAKEFLIPKLSKEAGLKENELNFDDDAISTIINDYTMEDGVRGLERTLSKVIRKFVLKEFTESESLEHTISKDKIESYLGAPLFDRSNEIKADKPGSSLGLSKSTVGGDVLRIEVVSTKGNGSLLQTGRLGDVLKESAEVAFTLLKSMYSKEDKADEFFKSNNFHLHLPEGAIQKDGPSAGSALFSAFYSLYKNTVIKPHLAMTGELNLLGEITPIGGLKDKLLGAKRNRVTDVIIPKGNKKDIDELDKEVLDGLTIHPVSNINEVIDIAFNYNDKDAVSTR